MKITKNYIKIWILSALTFSILLCAINYFIDPYKYYHQAPGTRELTGFEQSHKTWQVKMRQPDTVIMGNSRTLYGFDASLLEGDKPFNYSFPGPTIEEVEKQFENLLYMTKVKKVYIVTDRICALSKVSTRNLSNLFNNDLEMLKAEIGRAKYLLSINTLITSLKSLSKPVFYDNYGRRISFVFGKQSGVTLSERVQIREGYSLKRESSENNHCDTSVFERLLTKGHENNVNITLLLNPVHVRHIYIDSLTSADSNIYENMKVKLVKINRKIAEELEVKPYPIYDFNVINEYTTEKFEMSTNKEPEFWWESSHYKKALGDKVLDWINAKKPERNSGIGAEITSSNINKHNEIQKIKLDGWIASHPKVTEEIRALVH